MSATNLPERIGIPPAQKFDIDIFCRVIDNFGDIGICWRLCKDLATMGQSVRLWVDDLKSFSRIEPAIKIGLESQYVQVNEVRIAVMHWTNDFLQNITPSLFVIESFACELPESYKTNMPKHTCCWINLEYLATEPWAEETHLLPSPQPNGVPKYFYFPGFTEKTGGLIRENSLLQRLSRLRSDQKAKEIFFSRFIKPELLKRYSDDCRIIYVFCYQTAPIDAFLQGLLNAGQETIILWAPGCYRQFQQEIRQTASDGLLHHVEMPFVPQDDFDSILTACDFNIVRGEDSIVRALWSNQPFLWQLYPQDAQAHMDKLRAWLELTGFTSDIHDLFSTFNTGDKPAVRKLTEAFFKKSPETASTVYQRFSQQLAQAESLSCQLLDFLQSFTQKKLQ